MAAKKKRVKATEKRVRKQWKSVAQTKMGVKKVSKRLARKAKEKTPVRVSLPNPQSESPSSLKGIMKELQSLKTNVLEMEKEASFMAKPLSMKNMNPRATEGELPSEEVAVRLTRLYFEEIARLGFKRRLDFDAIINAYYYCLQRLRNKEKEMEIMRKVVEREENKLSGETKSQLFPEI